MSERVPGADREYQPGDLVRVGDDTKTVRRIAGVEHGMARLEGGSDEACFGFGLIIALRFLRPA